MKAFNRVLATAILMVATTFAAEAAVPGDPLVEGFNQPPHRAKPGVYWRWMAGNVSKEGITADLELLARLGFSYVLKFDITFEGKQARGPVTFNTSEYWDMMRHALKECDRLGIEFLPHNGSGWATSGGTWISKENGMRWVAFDRVETTGPRKLEVTLTRGDHFNVYEQIAVLAFPTPKGAAETLWSKSPKVSVTGMADFDPAVLHDGDTGSKQVTLDKDHSLLIELDQPATFRSAKMFARGARKLILESSDDGKDFKTISVLLPEQFSQAGPFSVPTTMSFPPVTTRWFRLRSEGRPTQVGEFDMSDAEIVHNLAGRALWDTQYELMGKIDEEGNRPGMDPGKILDISHKIDAAGRLVWDVPEGTWTILRICQGVKWSSQSPAEEAARGLESDKLSKVAVAEHFQGGMMPTVNIARELGVKSLTGVHFDSWESGQHNWTPGFEKEFQKRRGYDLKPYLPVLVGEVVGDRHRTERFLWDFRRTIGDLIAENNWKYYRQLAQEHGLRISLQPYGGAGSPFDELRCARYADVPQCEVWGGNEGRVYQYAQGIPGAAHVYGHKLISCETLTGFGGDWNYDLSDTKRSLDWIFASGVNAMCFHTSGHQPWKDPVGGVWDLPMYVHRGNPWFSKSGDWVKYIQRCQFLLQEGRYAGDMVYIYGEDTPMRLNTRMPDVPYGFQWDPCSAEYAIEAMSVENGKIAFPSGMRYEVLLLPPDARLTPELLRKVKEVVVAGATILGRKPIGSPSLANYPACDEEVRKLADELWPESAEPGAMRNVGKGRVINAWNPESIREKQVSYSFRDQAIMEAYLPMIFAQLKMQPTFTFTTVPDGKGPVVVDSGNITKRNVEFLHRHLDEGELFFVANNSENPLSIEADFRVTGLRPQLWYADSGRRVAVPEYQDRDGRTKLRIDFEPCGSVFVVFRKPGVGVDPEPFRIWNVVQTVDIAGPWEIAFQPNRGAPPKAVFEKLISWTDHEEFGIKYFSGTATYRKSVRIEAAPEKDRRWRLDLGRVKNLAGVKVNGVEFGTLWKPPFTVDVTSAIKAGENLIEIEITNNLFNRLVGDAQLPEDEGERMINHSGTHDLVEWPEWFLKGEPRPTQRVTLLDKWPSKINKDTPLQVSGLLGPVKLIEEK